MNIDERSSETRSHLIFFLLVITLATFYMITANHWLNSSDVRESETLSPNSVQVDDT